MPIIDDPSQLPLAAHYTYISCQGTEEDEAAFYRRLDLVERHHGALLMLGDLLWPAGEQNEQWNSDTFADVANIVRNALAPKEPTTNTCSVSWKCIEQVVIDPTWVNPKAQNKLQALYDMCQQDYCGKDPAK